MKSWAKFLIASWRLTLVISWVCQTQSFQSKILIPRGNMLFFFLHFWSQYRNFFYNLFKNPGSSLTSFSTFKYFAPLSSSILSDEKSIVILTYFPCKYIILFLWILPNFSHVFLFACLFFAVLILYIQVLIFNLHRAWNSVSFLDMRLGACHSFWKDLGVYSSKYFFCSIPSFFLLVLRLVTFYIIWNYLRILGYLVIF